MVYIADTYNHKIKKTDSEGNCVTVCGDGKPSKSSIVGFFCVKNLLKAVQSTDEPSDKNVLFQFNEPSGLAVSQNGDILYIADTNNHSIKTLNLKDIQKIEVVNNLYLTCNSR